MSCYSFSQIQLFEQCPLKYRYQYVDKIDVREDSLSFALGIAVHSALEFLYNTIFLFGNKVPELHVVLGYFNECRERELSSFFQLPEIGTIGGYHERGVLYLSRYYNKFYPFDHTEFVKQELNIVTHLSKDIYLQGKIDRVDIIARTVEIIDYKTNQSLSASNKVAHREQIGLYGMGLMQKYEGRFDTIIGRIVYLHFNDEDRWSITEDYLDHIRVKYLQSCQTIDNLKLQFSFFESDAFHPKAGVHCSSCKFREICVAGKEFTVSQNGVGEL